MRGRGGGGRWSSPRRDEIKAMASGSGSVREGGQKALSTNGGGTFGISGSHGEDMDVEKEGLLHVDVTSDVFPLAALESVDPAQEGVVGQGKVSGTILDNEKFLHGAVTSGIVHGGKGTTVKEGLKTHADLLGGHGGSVAENLLNAGDDPDHALVWKQRKVVPLPGKSSLGEFSLAKDRILLDQEDILSSVKKMDCALVGRMFGRKIPFVILNNELHRRWQGFGAFRLITISGDCFVCFFDNPECRDAVLMGGPWIISGQVLGLDCWSPEFSSSSAKGFVTPIWIRMPGLPLYCWGECNIARIAACVGEPLWMDTATSRMERGLFARVCVKVDLSQPLLPGVWAEGPYGCFFQKLEYEGQSSFCFNCGKVGHKMN